MSVRNSTIKNEGKLTPPLEYQRINFLINNTSHLENISGEEPEDLSVNICELEEQERIKPVTEERTPKANTVYTALQRRRPSGISSRRENYFSRRHKYVSRNKINHSKTQDITECTRDTIFSFGNDEAQDSKETDFNNSFISKALTKIIKAFQTNSDKENENDNNTTHDDKVIIAKEISYPNGFNNCGVENTPSFKLRRSRSSCSSRDVYKNNVCISKDPHKNKINYYHSTKNPYIRMYGNDQPFKKSKFCLKKAPKKAKILSQRKSLQHLYSNSIMHPKPHTILRSPLTKLYNY